MKLYISVEVMQAFHVEIEKFGAQRICLSPVWIEGAEPKVWAMTDARNSAEVITELKSTQLSIWLPQRCLAELDEQVIVRSRRGFTTCEVTDALRSQATLFVAEDH
ncbi:MAG TPA: hypothetical protein PLX62_12985 [Bacteroidales bacterium]|jgi:hypothetical protein|nr:hypothetical protein [Bacteroidales bacterium]